jgi:isopenicillin N synthase-like dioxygenase
LLLQNNVDGLQVFTNEGKWIDAPYIPNTVLVNSGDILSMWTNNKFKSTNHRVILTPQNAAKSRYSIVYFCVPNWEAPISLPELNSNSEDTLVGDVIPFT